MHVTPAGFASSVKKCGMEGEIAQQYYEGEVDVLLGGGLRFFRCLAKANDAESDVVDRISDFKKHGYRFVQSKSEVYAQAGNPELLDLFSVSHVPYAIDRYDRPWH